MTKETQNTELSEDKALHIGGVVTCWLDFNDKLPEPEQRIYVLDRFGQIEKATHQGDWQKKYWTTYDYRWTTRPACR